MSDLDSTKSVPIPRAMWVAALLSAIPSFLFGYALAALNSCLVTGDGNDPVKCYENTDDSTNNCPVGTIYNDLNLTAIEAQIATSLTVLGAWIGCFCGSSPAEKYGRRSTILYNNVFFLLGAGLCASGSEILLYIGRFVVGLGVGVESVVVPVLLSEIATDESKGTITTLHQVELTFAIFVVGMVGYGFVEYVPHGWQYVQAGIALPALIMIICAPLVPESPKWLVQQGKTVEALRVLAYLRADRTESEHQKELETISIETSQKNKADQGIGEEEDPVSWNEVFAAKKAMTIGCGLMFFSALSGINTVIFYSTSIFSFAGFDEAILATASVGGVNFLTTIYAAYLVDTMGRKTLLLGGLYLMFFSLLLLSLVLTTANSAGSAQGIVAVVATLIYVVGYAVGLGAVTWTVMSEIVPTKIRSKAVSLFVCINWFCNLIIGLLTLTAINSLGGVTNSMDDDDKIEEGQKKGVAFLYFIFAGICFSGIMFIRLYVPETKGKTPEELAMGEDETGSKQDYSYSAIHGGRDDKSGPLSNALLADGEW